MRKLQNMQKKLSSIFNITNNPQKLNKEIISQPTATSIDYAQAYNRNSNLTGDYILPQEQSLFNQF